MIVGGAFRSSAAHRPRSVASSRLPHAIAVAAAPRRRPCRCRAPSPLPLSLPRTIARRRLRRCRALSPRQPRAVALAAAARRRRCRCRALPRAVAGAAAARRRRCCCRALSRAAVAAAARRHPDTGVVPRAVRRRQRGRLGAHTEKLSTGRNAGTELDVPLPVVWRSS